MEPDLKSAQPASPRCVWPAWICAALPSGLLGVLTLMMVHVRLGLGHWPTNLEGYSTAAWNLHCLAGLGLFWSSAFGAPIVWLGLLAFRATRGRGGSLGWQGLVFFAGWAAVLGLWHADPLGFVTWLRD